jgi:hypothetical protein
LSTIGEGLKQSSQHCLHAFEVEPQRYLEQGAADEAQMAHAH